MEKNQQTQAQQTQQKPVEQNKLPNESGTLQIDAFVKIFDPKTKEVFVEKRA